MDGCGGALTWASNHLAAHLQDPSLSKEAAKHIEKAIEHLVGNKDGQGKNGAVDKCAKGDLNPALEKVREAIKELREAEKKQPGLNLADEKNFLALAAKSVAVVAIKAAVPLADKPDEMREARGGQSPGGKGRCAAGERRLRGYGGTRLSQGSGEGEGHQIENLSRDLSGWMASRPP